VPSYPGAARTQHLTSGAACASRPTCDVRIALRAAHCAFGATVRGTGPVIADEEPRVLSGPSVDVLARRRRATTSAERRIEHNEPDPNEHVAKHGPSDLAQCPRGDWRGAPPREPVAGAEARLRRAFAPAPGLESGQGAQSDSDAKDSAPLPCPSVSDPDDGTQLVPEPDPVEAALALGIREASIAKRWDVVGALARELEARRVARQAPNVVVLRPARDGERS
jgi:hypothetical protein